MRARRFTWRWWLLVVGSPLVVAGGIGLLVDNVKLWAVVMIVGAVLTLVGSPIWAGLRAPKNQ